MAVVAPVAPAVVCVLVCTCIPSMSTRSFHPVGWVLETPVFQGAYMASTRLPLVLVVMLGIVTVVVASLVAVPAVASCGSPLVTAFCTATIAPALQLLAWVNTYDAPSDPPARFHQTRKIRLSVGLVHVVISVHVPSGGVTDTVSTTIDATRISFSTAPEGLLIVIFVRLAKVVEAADR